MIVGQWIILLGQKVDNHFLAIASPMWTFSSSPILSSDHWCRPPAQWPTMLLRILKQCTPLMEVNCSNETTMTQKLAVADRLFVQSTHMLPCKKKKKNDNLVS